MVAQVVLAGVGGRVVFGEATRFFLDLFLFNG